MNSGLSDSSSRDLEFKGVVFGGLSSTCVQGLCVYLQCSGLGAITALAPVRHFEGGFVLFVGVPCVFSGYEPK